MTAQEVTDIFNESLAGIEDSEINNSIKVFPNPTSDIVTIGTPKHGTIELCNLFSEVLQSIESTGMTNLNLSIYPAGIYLIRYSGSSVKLIKI